MKSLVCLALSGAATVASAQSSGAVATQPVLAVRSATTQPITAGSAETFSGAVRINSPFMAVPPGKAGGATVTFTAGARTAWHTHPLGQTLIVIDGLGLVQQAGQPAQTIRPGDVVTIPPNVRHWHGAGAAGPMTHIAIAEKENGISVAWNEKVSEQDYEAALVSAGLPVVTGLTGPVVAAAHAASDTLTARQRAIPVIAAFMATSDMPRLNAALNQGLDAGMTLSEAKEVLVQLYAYAGFPRSLNALGELLKVVELLRQSGIHDASGHEPSRAIATGRDLLVAGKANQTEISGGPVQGAVFDFAPVINQFLQAHLFGDIFERDNLDWQSRELATLGALAATPGAEAQLRSHMRASLRVGLSAAQLQQLTQTLAEQVNPEVAARAREALSQALSNAPKG
jgi:4-carboxymuconolactone decarboxylase